MTRAFLALGTNLGDRVGYLRRAVETLPDLEAVSPVYETDPVGGPDQDAFLNMVCQLETQLGARQLLALAHSLERDAERVREMHWGPRTLDVDVIWVDGETVDDEDLIVPHPRFRDRMFVMAPLVDLAPDLAEPGWAQRAEGEVRGLGALSDL